MWNEHDKFFNTLFRFALVGIIATATFTVSAIAFLAYHAVAALRLYSGW